MVDAVTNNYSLVEPTVGGDTNLWGGVLNNGVIVALDSIMGGILPASITSVDVVLTAPQFQNAGYTLTGVLTGNRSLSIPLSPNSATVACAGRFFVDNATTGAFNVTVKTTAAGSTGVAVPQGLRTWLYSDGTNVKYADDSKVYIVPVSGSPNGQLAGTAGSVNNPPFPLAFDYVGRKLYLPITTGDALTTVWNNFVIGSSPLPTALFTALVIKVTDNTHVTVQAGSVSVSDGAGNYQTVVPPGTGTPINFGTTGPNALDANAITQATWYAIWVIAKTDGTVACLASTSFTFADLTLPAGYTYAGRIGAVRSAPAVGQLLGTWQFGRRAHYKVGLAQCAALPNIANGVAGTYSDTAPVFATPSISAVIPPTASKISIVGTLTWNNANLAAVIIAPSSSYAGASSTNPPPLILRGANPITGCVEFVVEGTTVAWCSNGTGGAISCMEWEDNI